MENIIEYYYNIKIINIIKKESNYIIKTKKHTLLLKEIQNTNNINEIILLFQTIPLNTIIINKENSFYTIINNKIYTLILEKYPNTLSLPNISNLSNKNIPPINSLERNNWEILWENKIDYIEEYIFQNEKKYPLIRESIDYFIGLSENAISYLVNTKKTVPKDNYLDRKVISHISLTNSLYDPYNIIFDHKARDIAEYIKLSFFINNLSIYKELDEYFKYNNYSKYGIMILYSRILYPSFYFNLFDNIITNKIEEKNLNKIINKIDKYQTYLYDIHKYLNKYYDIPFPLWLNKKQRN